MTFPYETGNPVPLFLAPMAGVSERPYRLLCRRFGADVVVSEFLSSEGLRRRNERTLEMAAFDETERPIGIQIFGAEPAGMAEAAALVTEVFQPEFVDINFGCPVKKVVKRNGGSGCLKDLDLVERIIRSVVAATPLPVTVKIRSGWDETTRDPVSIALRCQEAGARALTLHARTRTQMFAGEARWEEIGAVANALDIPVIGNGDVTTPEDVVRMQETTGCSGVMIARGSFGNPWVFAQARALLDGRPMPPDPTPEERFQTALEHARLTLAVEGDTPKAAVEFRKHLGWYTRGLPGSAELRARLHQVESLADVEHFFADYLGSQPVLAAV
ncbi:MAG: tRNA dihydrouridine synthase DusB [Gemmatimonadetes bacterium]|nr:tRNA dihydrouridine synthase DusB [Gemmatimonadota bacterium]